MLVFNKYFYRKKKSKLYFGDRVTVLNDFIYQTGGVLLETRYHKQHHHDVRKLTQKIIARHMYRDDVLRIT
jgi:hypothetical protein